MIALITGFLSLILVIPHISGNQELYGIYAYVVSLSLYFTYADIGFISSGQKYASEAFARAETEEEEKLLGFTIAVLICMFVPMIVIFIYCYLTPTSVFKDLSVEGAQVASGLFLALSFLVPLQIILQRAVSMILSIRLLDFISTRIDIFFNIIKLSSLFYFFRQDSFMIVEYFYFCTFVTIIGSLIGCIYINYRVDFKLWQLLCSIRLSKEYYKKTKGLAFASAAITLGFVLYYELDLVLIGYLFGTKEIATYAVALTFVGFLRRIWSIIYSPVSVRLNHFVGLSERSEIITLMNRVIYYSFPLCIVVTVTLVLSANSVVVAWVGPDYLETTLLLQILVISFFPAYLTNPGFHFFVSHGRRGYLYLLAIVLPLGFYIFIFLFYHALGVASFAYGKIAVGMIELTICWVGLRNIIRPGAAIKKWVFPSVIWCLAATTLLPLLMAQFDLEAIKSSVRLLQILFILGCFILLSYLAFLIIYKKDRLDVIYIAKLGLRKIIWPCYLKW